MWREFFTNTDWEPNIITQTFGVLILLMFAGCIVFALWMFLIEWPKLDREEKEYQESTYGENGGPYYLPKFLNEDGTPRYAKGSNDARQKDA